MSGTEIPVSVQFIPAVNSALCSLIASYTLISILDHERWMKEWGDDHEAVPVMHLRKPILSAAVAMGIGGVTTVHQVSLASIELDGEHLSGSILITTVAAVLGVTTMFLMLQVARKDEFAGVDRVDVLKKVILKNYTIAQLKRQKGLGRRTAYFGRLTHVVGAGLLLAVGIMGTWVLHVIGLSGDFVVVWRVWPIFGLAIFMLVAGVVSSWLLFRMLVWKPSNEPLRPLCSLVFALSLWWIDHFGKKGAIGYEYLEGRAPNGNFGAKFEAGQGAGQWLLLLLAFVGVLTQYAIALELRVAYCGLQDWNLDLQMLTGTAGGDDHTRKNSAVMSPSGKRRSTQGLRSPPDRSRRRTSPAGRKGPASPTGGVTNMSMASAAQQMKPATSSTLVSAVFRMSSTAGITSMGQSRSIRVQPVGAEKPYIVNGGGDDDKGEERGEAQLSDNSVGWEVVRPNGGGQVVGVGPAKKIALPNPVV